MKFQLLIKTKIPTNKEISCFQTETLRCCITKPINVKMPTIVIVGILTFISMKNTISESLNSLNFSDPKNLNEYLTI